MKTTLEVLTEAKALIDTPEKWCKNAIGHFLVTTDHCALGAIRSATRSGLLAALPASNALTRSLGVADLMGVVDWNNAPERHHAEVLAAFDRAITDEKARLSEHAVHPFAPYVPDFAPVAA